MRLIFILVIIIRSSIALAQENFEVIISTDENELIYKGLQHPNGSYFLTGRQGFDFNTSIPYLMKITESGIVKDTVIYREGTNGFFPTFEFLDNGNILFIGHCKLQDTVTKFDHLWLCEMDTNLNIIQESTFYMLKDNYYEYYSWYSLIDSSGAIIIAGNYKYYPGHHDMIYSKISQNSDTLMTKSYHYQFGQIAGQISLKCDNNYLSVVERISPSHPLSLVELDTNLSIINIAATPQEYNFAQGLTITWINDSTFFQSASRYDNNYEFRSIGAVLSDSNYQIKQEVNFDRPDTNDSPAINFSHSYFNDSTIYICGYQSYASFYILTPSAIFLYLLDKNLNVLGHLDLGGDVNYKMWGVTATADGGCLLYGTIYDNPDGLPEYDIYIRKLIREEIAIITEVFELSDAGSNIKIFPLPADNILNIQLPISVNKASCSIFDLSGRLIFKKEFHENGNLITLNINNLNKGTYIISFQFPDYKEFSSKFIKN